MIAKKDTLVLLKHRRCRLQPGGAGHEIFQRV